MSVPGDETRVRIVAVDLSMGQLFELSMRLLLVSVPAMLVVGFAFSVMMVMLGGLLSAV